MTGHDIAKLSHSPEQVVRIPNVYDTTLLDDGLHDTVNAHSDGVSAALGFLFFFYFFVVVARMEASNQTDGATKEVR